MKKNIVKTIALLMVMVFASGNVFASSYTYNFKAEPVETPEAVRVKIYADASHTGILMRSPRDFDIDENGHCFVVDTGNNRIVRLDESFRLIETYSEFVMKDGSITSINEPTGIHMSLNGKAYIADGGNQRVLVLDQDMKTVHLELKVTAEEVFRREFSFRPLKVVADSSGRTYVIADGMYDGLMEFDPQGRFLGFTGASRIIPNIVEWFWNFIGTEEQRRQRLRSIPTEFTNLCIDNEGFVFTVSSNVDQWNPQASEPVRRQTAMGMNILRYDPILGMPIGDLEFPYPTSTARVRGPSRLVDISARMDYGYACLDSARGRIFVYNTFGEMMFVFGGTGVVAGLFQQPVAVACHNDMVIVLDRANGALTVFEYSEYANSIMQAQDDYLSGRYEESMENWEAALRINSNLDMAYSGIGKILIRESEYQKAMQYLRYSGNKQYYSKAFEYYRREFVEEWFVLIFFSIITLIVLLVLYVKIWRKKLKSKEGLKKYPWYRGLKFGLHIMTHPFDGFWDMIHEKRGNYGSAAILYGLFGVTFILDKSLKGFLFQPLDEQFNIFAVLTAALLPVALWCLCNWATTTLMDGDGKPGHIAMGMAYALMPYILTQLPMIVLSNFISLDEAMIIYVFTAFGILWSGFLVFAGLLTIHNYTPSKTLGTMGVTLVGMASVVFITSLFVNLVMQLMSFVVNIYNEIVIRL